MSNAYAQLQNRLGEVDDLNRAGALLAWDQETYMPRGGITARADQLATLSRVAYMLFINDDTRRMIDAAATETAHLPYESDAASLVRVAHRDFEQTAKLPVEFVTEFTRLTAQARVSWAEARHQNQFALFQPDLEQIVTMVRQQADYLGYRDHPYDALLDLYEPDMRAAQVRTLFTELRTGLHPLVELVKANPHAVDDSLLHLDYDPATQLKLSEQILRTIGFDFACGRQDLAIHPFCTAFGPSDVRLTTRVAANELQQGLYGSLHEMGHGLYEQGFPATLARTSLANGASLGFHESQSRMWENLVGRSRDFVHYFFPLIRDTFPAQLAHANEEAFFRAVNRAKPSFIRVEADELTYNLHILLRFELELWLVDGTLKVADLPAAWSEQMQALLGVTPPTHAQGVLQDVHWSGGMIGYFPTYTLGNVIAAQLFNRAKLDIPDLESQFAVGQFGGLLGWMRTNLHVHGRKFTPVELLQRITGGGLDAKPYLTYLRDKCNALYA